MTPADILIAAADSILAEATAYHDRAILTLDDLAAWGREPELDDDWFLAKAQPPPRCEPNLEAVVVPIPRAPRQSTERQRAEVTQQVQQAITEAEAAAAIGTAHLENPSDWGRRIAAAMEGRQHVGFWALVDATGLSSGELLLGLLFGGWQLEQREFYGEVEVSYR